MSNATPFDQRKFRLACFLSQIANEPFIYGQNDCAMMPANWCLSESGIDPAAIVRGQYQDEEGWQTLADSYGGLFGLWDMLAVESGMKCIDAPTIGDIGLVRIPKHGLYGAVKGGCDRWMVKLSRGLIGGNFKSLSAWSVPCHKQ